MQRRKQALSDLDKIWTTFDCLASELTETSGAIN